MADIVVAGAWGANRCVVVSGNKTGSDRSRLKLVRNVLGEYVACRRRCHLLYQARAAQTSIVTRSTRTSSCKSDLRCGCAARCETTADGRMLWQWPPHLPKCVSKLPRSILVANAKHLRARIGLGYIDDCEQTHTVLTCHGVVTAPEVRSCRPG